MAKTDAALAEPPAPHLDRAEWRDLDVRVQDGVRIHARLYGGRAATGLPVICLPGLSRSARDFHDLAIALNSGKGPARPVLVIEARGRGQSEWSDPSDYNLLREMADVLDVCAAGGIGHAVIVGSSRGGLLTMLLSAPRPAMIKGVVLHDVGPEIGSQGLARIRQQLAAQVAPKSFEDAADMLKRAQSALFPALSDDDWLWFAKTTFVEKDGRIIRDYDPRLLETLGSIDFEQPLPDLWKEFDALAHAPMMVIRGETSDVLTVETVAKIKRRRPDSEIMEVPGQGHVPPLRAGPIVTRIVRFIDKIDR